MRDILHLLKIELKKVLPNRAFRILIGLYLLALIAAPYLMENSRLLKSAQSVFEFPMIWFFYYLGGMFVSFILAIIFITVTCNEYTYGTIRQNVIDGFSRTDTVIAKVSVMLFLATITTLIFFVNGLLAGYMNTMQPESADILKKVGWVPGYFLHTFMIMSFGFFLSTLVRRTGIALILFVVWLMFLEPSLAAISEWKKLGFREFLPAYGVLYPLGIDLGEIFDDGPEKIMEWEKLIPNALTSMNMVLKAVYSCIFIGLSWFLVNRRGL